jgi:hypothetical protein
LKSKIKLIHKEVTNSKLKKSPSQRNLSLRPLQELGSVLEEAQLSNHKKMKPKKLLYRLPTVMTQNYLQS